MVQFGRIVTPELVGECSFVPHVSLGLNLVVVLNQGAIDYCLLCR